MTRRIQTYVPVVQEFSSRVVFFHAAVAESLGLHLTDLKALHLLGRESMTAGALGEQVGLSLSAVTALVDRLEHAGYVTREREAADRRKVTVHIIPVSLRKVDELYSHQYLRMSKLLAKYSQAEFAGIIDFLEQTSSILKDEARKVRRDR